MPAYLWHCLLLQCSFPGGLPSPGNLLVWESTLAPKKPKADKRIPPSLAAAVFVSTLNCCLCVFLCPEVSSRDDEDDEARCVSASNSHEMCCLKTGFSPDA